MKTSFFISLFGVALLASAPTAGATARASQARTLQADGSDVRFWVCRSEPTTGEGYFMGMGRSQAEAHARAEESCKRFHGTCRTSCAQEESN